MNAAMIGQRARFTTLAVSLLLGFAGLARGGELAPQLSVTFKIDHNYPEASVPSVKERNANPLEFGYFLQDLLERGERARQENDLRAVVLYARAVVKAVPERAKSWTKLCEAYERVADRDKAIRACKAALTAAGVELQDYLHYLHLVLDKEGDLSPEERKSLDGVVAHLDAQPGQTLVAEHVRCELGVKAKDVALLRRCTSALDAAAPNDPKTIIFAWTLAVREGRTADAAQLLERAQAAGVVVANLERMEKVTFARAGWSWSRWSLAGAALLLVVAASAWALRRRRPGLAARATS